MSHFITLSLNDLRTSFRDPVFKGLLFFPFICFGLIRFVLPWVFASYPALQDYSPVILMWACLQSATMFGFIYGFLFLEEKEENIWQAINVLPISGLQLVLSRLFVGIIISSVVNFTLIHFGGIVRISIFKELFICVLFSLAAPVISLVLGTFAKNRIEGLAQMKIVNILMIIPALIYFLPSKALHFMAILPTYWSFRSMEKAVDGTINEFCIFLLIGFIFQLLIILVLSKRLAKSVNQ